MESQRTFYAVFASRAGGRNIMPVADEAAALQMGLATRAVSFYTYEADAINTVNGLRVGDSSKPMNVSPKRYLAVNKVYLRDDVLAIFRREIAIIAKRLETLPSTMDEITLASLKEVMASYECLSAERAYLGKQRHNPREFIELKPGEKVYNAFGVLLWPANPAPVPGRSLSGPSPS